ncbi:MAG: pilus assembly protein TadG-related protein, partial [Thermaurantiacus sp.]
MSTSGIQRRLSQVRRNWQALGGNRRGAVAAIFAITVPVLVGFTALAVDFGYYRMVQNRMQIAVDGATLAAAWEIENGGDVVGAAVDFVAANVPGDFGAMTLASDVTLGSFDTANGFQPNPADPNDINAVEVRGERSPPRGNPVQQFFLAIFGVEPPVITARAIGARPANVWYQPPESMNLPPEAGDFNELYVYCYNTETRQIRDGTMTLIANNLGGESVVSMTGSATIAAREGLVNPPRVEDLDWPRCNQRGETLSFRMRNIRHAKSNRQLWANPTATISGMQPGRPEFNYYTD